MVLHKINSNSWRAMVIATVQAYARRSIALFSKLHFRKNNLHVLMYATNKIMAVV